MPQIDHTTLARSYHTLHYRQQLQQALSTCGVGKLDGLTKYQLHQKTSNILLRHHQGEQSLKYKLARAFRKKDYVAAFEVRAKDSRADFVVINGDSKCFEIKSKVDTLRRLDKQSADYHHVFEYNTVVVDSKHLETIASTLPQHYGIWYFDGNRRVEYRAADRSPSLDPIAQLAMLTKQERKTAFGNTELNAILSDFDADTINEGLKTILKKRYADRWQFINYHWKEILPIDLQFFFNTNVHPGLIYAD